MLQAFIITLREGVEAALIVGIALAYLAKISRPELRRVVYFALGAAFVASLGVALVLARLSLNQDIFEGWVMLLAAALTVTMVIFMARAARRIKGQIEGRVGAFASQGSRLGLFAFVFFMVLREGVEMVLMEWRRRAPVAAAGSAAEQRKARWSERRERLWMAALYVSTFAFILMITAQFIYAKSVSALSPATQLQIVDGKVTVPLAQISDKALNRFVVRVNGTEVRFLLYRKPDGNVATVMDACNICGAVGFYQTSGGLVCKNCAAPVNPQAVGQPGGCNPIPLAATTSGDAVAIAESDLAAAAVHFQH